MKLSSFEERFTAWLDDKLPENERADFEKELRDKGLDPESERREAEGVGQYFRKYSLSPQLGNPEFFNHQLLHRIAQEQPSVAVAPRRWWMLPRLAWAGLACLLMAFGLFEVIIPHGAQADRSDYFAQVIDARPGDDAITADTVYTKRDNVTVVWLDGLDYLPADYQLQ